MRVSDAEREAAAAELREHFASGRLDQEELNERLDRVFAAKTRGDLNGPSPTCRRAGAAWDRARRAHAGGGPPGWPGRRGRRPGSWDAPPQWGLPGGGRTGGPGLGRSSAGSCSPASLLSVLLVVGILGAFGSAPGGRSGSC